MTRAFEAAPFTFVVDDGYTAVELMTDGVEMAIDDLDERLRPHVPKSAAIASWVLARLVALIEPDGEERIFGLSRETVDHVDDGLYVLDFVVSDAGQVVGKVQVQGGAIGVGLLGVVRDAHVGEAVLAAFEARICADPDDVARCEVRIVDTNSADATVLRYGWDGTAYFG